ncbi:LON peptidase substrate-binding domain-containing protein [Hydrogenophaga sp.]|uniref:LON peptidase substrate-binding domain-containing protein n=1 Tax=Hydrogenophaga sp. TaxID=1904254 RepID=UPI003569BDFE
MNEAKTELLGLSKLPLFPLESVLFPGGWLSLRVFEVRYLDMISRCHKAGAPFGVVCLTEGREVRQRDEQSTKGEGFAKESFFPVGTLAHIAHLERPQPGLLMIRCRGEQRFQITHSHQMAHGLWLADVQLDEPEPVVAVPDDLRATRDALQKLLHNLQEREPGSLAELPLQPPYAWDDSGWVANRWVELLPAPAELKHRLMALDNPLLRLELVSDLLDRLGVVK